MKRIQRIFLPVCCLAILIFFSCLCLKDLFGDVALDQMLWHVKNAELLAQGHTDELKILRYIFTAILYMALCCGLFLHDRKIAAWIHRALVKLASRLSLSLSLAFCAPCTWGNYAYALLRSPIWDTLSRKCGAWRKCSFTRKVLRIALS